jgi:hypothetical protein
MQVKIMTESTRAVTYCSFATDECCPGVCILDGILDPVAAAITAHTLGINLGGQLVAMPCYESDSDIPPDIFEIMWINRNRLISAEEAKGLFEAKSVHEFDTEENAKTCAACHGTGAGPLSTSEPGLTAVCPSCGGTGKKGLAR